MKDTWGKFADRKKSSFSGFACHCGPDNEAKLKRLHDWVTQTWTPGWKPEFYATGMLYVLAGSYSAWVEEVPLDPGGWGAIVTRAGAAKYIVGTPLRTYVQFDRFEDGLALTLWAMYQKYGKKRARRKGAD